MCWFRFNPFIIWTWWYCSTWFFLSKTPIIAFRTRGLKDTVFEYKRNKSDNIANLNGTNYITDRVFKTKSYNSNDNKIFSYESNNKKLDLDLPFIEKQTIYKGLNNIRLKYPNPVYKSRIENFLNDFHKMINLYKTNIKNN